MLAWSIELCRCTIMPHTQAALCCRTLLAQAVGHMSLLHIEALALVEDS